MNEFFNDFAESASRQVARAWFFALCVLAVFIWAPTYFLFENIDTWQLVINTGTTIVTFLLVALLQNTQQRFQDSITNFQEASNCKQNAIAKGIGDLLEKDGLTAEAQELYDVMGIEEEAKETES